MKIKYNSPVVLTFAFVCAAILFFSQTLIPNLNLNWFAVAGKKSFSASSFHSWITMFTHVIGHASWTHLLSNFSFILLIGPILEENYGSVSLLIMIIITALVTGLLSTFFFDNRLLGASGVVFMMILLASFTNFKQGEIPLTFILILILYMGRELYNSFADNNVSEFAHIVGGFCGSLFGFFERPQVRAPQQPAPPPPSPPPPSAAPQQQQHK